MNNFTKEKKQQIAFVAMMTIAFVAVIWFFLITSQQKSVAEAQKKADEARHKVESAQKLLKQTEQIREELAEVQSELRLREETMASGGDLYQWILIQMNTLTSARPVYNFTASQQTLVDALLIPKFPYRAASYSIRLNGHFHDLGRFIADVENQFPYARIQNIDLTPATAQAPERLNLSFDFITLYHTNRPVSIK
ncbi:MAG: hypothetical protein H0X66_17200 [Verrucomicrobia bacterium]|nr:hypothetical protein [Verrucomicrobiota bacterium]